jgi:hypothetical protein
VDAKNKVVQNEPPGKERMRGRFSVAPLIIFPFSRIINKINGVNTVFLYYKHCSFSLISALRTGCPAPGSKFNEKSSAYPIPYFFRFLNIPL